MPICLADMHVSYLIRKITGSDKTKTHLGNLGFIVGEPIMLINRIEGNVIVKIKGVSMAITEELARRILV